MKIIYLFILTFLCIYFAQCGNHTEEAKMGTLVQSTVEKKTDSTERKPIIEDIIGKAIKTDSLLNPYLTQSEDEEMQPCNNQTDTAALFNCIVSQFKTAKLPIQFGPLPEPDYMKQKGLHDSLFIVQCLRDTSFYQDAPEDRVYSWYKGKLIERRENYTLCVMMFGFNVGFQYYLCSFNRKGQLIDKKEVGAQASDWYEIYGFINNSTSFEIFKNEFDYKKEKPVIKTKTHEKYIITSEGRFEKSK